MEQRLECSMVKDLLPLYIDGVVSEETEKEIIEHIKTCSECREVYQSMIQEIPDMKREEMDSQKNFLRHARAMYVLYALNGLSGLAILSCFIVNLAVSHGLTWFPIVAVSNLYVCATVNTIVMSRKDKFFRGMLVFSAGLILLLVTIQVSMCRMMGGSSVWLLKFGFPIAILWLVLLWLPLILHKYCNCNIYDSVGILLILLAIGNYLTKMITGDIASKADFFSGILFLQNGLCFLLGAILFFIIGRK